MMRIATVSCRSGSKIFSYFLRSRSLFISRGVDDFEGHPSPSGAREGDGCMKDTDHRVRHSRVHLDDRATAQRTRGCAWRDDQFGRGQNTVLGWSDPTFAHGSVAKVSRGSLQPNRNSFGARRENLGETGAEGKDYTLHLRLHRSSSPRGARNFFDESRMQKAVQPKVTVEKKPKRAAATPLFRPSAAQKVRGVAPPATQEA